MLKFKSEFIYVCVYMKKWFSRGSDEESRRAGKAAFWKEGRTVTQEERRGGIEPGRGQEHSPRRAQEQTKRERERDQLSLLSSRLPKDNKSAS